MIELKEFDFPADDYFRLLRYLGGGKYSWYMFWNVAILFGVMQLMYGLRVDVFVVLIVGLAFIGLLLFLLGLVPYFIARYYAYAKENRSMLQKRRMVFRPDGYEIFCEDGSESRGPLSHFVRVDVWGDYYLLFMNKILCFPIPFSAFASEEERQRFEAEFLAGISRKKKDWRLWITAFFLICLLVGLTIGMWLHANSGNDDEMTAYDSRERSEAQ